MNIIKRLIVILALIGSIGLIYTIKTLPDVFEIDFSDEDDDGEI